MKSQTFPDMVADAYILSSRDAEAGVQGQPGIHSKNPLTEREGEGEEGGGGGKEEERKRRKGGKGKEGKEAEEEEQGRGGEKRELIHTFAAPISPPGNESSLCSASTL
jgi:hypothetical protein